MEYEHPTEGAREDAGLPDQVLPHALEVPLPAPLTGQHTREVLHEAGLDDAAVDALLAAGAVDDGVADRPCAA